MLSASDVASGDYDTVIVAAADVQGRLFGRRIPCRRFSAAVEEGIEICTCALAWDISQDLSAETALGGWHTGWHDFRLRPDLRTLRPYPGVPGTAICLSDAVDDEGLLLDVAPRSILRRQIDRARRLGYDVFMASELEFYMYLGTVRDARLRRFQDLQPTTITRSDYSIVGQAVQEPFIARIRNEMDRANIPIFACQAEYGFGQWEVNLDHAPALEMADRHVIYKAGIKEMALQSDLAVTFMAKPSTSDFGSSCHIHCSLRSKGEPVFAADGGHALSQDGMGFLGGLMSHLSDTALFFAPSVNSYKRHAAEDVGGGINAWGYDNRTVTFRVVGKEDSLRIEHRYAGADVNPYLAAAAIIVAGLDGIEAGTDPGPPLEGNAYAHTDLQRAPACLPDAINAFAHSSFTSNAFGPGVVAHYQTLAHAEWSSFLKAVTDWEIMSAFEIV